MKLDLCDFGINIAGYVAPCHCKCNHCLLGCGENILSKVDYNKFREVALKFKDWKIDHNIEVCFYPYNCAEFEEYKDSIDVNRQLDFQAWWYMNINGTEMRCGKELENWLDGLFKHGISCINISWFGDETFHDAFVNRKGYFGYLFEVLETAGRIGLTVNNMLYLLKSNLSMLYDLYNKLNCVSKKSGKYFSLLDYLGSSRKRMNEFISLENYEALPDFIKNTISRNKYKTEAEWLDIINTNRFVPPTKRVVNIMVTPENVDELLQLTAGEIVGRAHSIDIKLQAAIPGFKYLADNYGSSSSNILFDFRSLIWYLTEKHFNANPSLDKSLMYNPTAISCMWK